VSRDKLRLFFGVLLGRAQELNQPLPADCDVNFRSGKSVLQSFLVSWRISAQENLGAKVSTKLVLDHSEKYEL
jgi:hypothetical protein